MVYRPVLFLACTLFSGTPAFAEDTEISDILIQNPDPFLDLNMGEIIAAYEPNGSGIGLVLGGTPLVRSSADLRSDATTIDGSTGIISDPNGFGFTIGLAGDYLFGFDESALTEEAREALSEVLVLYNEYEGTAIAIAGHTDSKGSDTYNQTLSERRATVVSQWFADNGIDESLITAQGFGEAQPVAENELDGRDNPEGRSQNRRVEIHITTIEKVNFVPLELD